MGFQCLYWESALVFSPMHKGAYSEVQKQSGSLQRSIFGQKDTSESNTQTHTEAAYLETIKTIMQEELPGVRHN